MSSSTDDIEDLALTRLPNVHESPGIRSSGRHDRRVLQAVLGPLCSGPFSPRAKLVWKLDR